MPAILHTCYFASCQKKYEFLGCCVMILESCDHLRALHVNVHSQQFLRADFSIHL